MFLNILEIIKVMWLIFWKFWPLWVILLVIFAIRLFFNWLDLKIYNWRISRKFKKGEEWRSDRELIQWLRAMNPTEFEIYIADLFQRLGYKTEAIGGSHDGGIDVVAEKDGIKHIFSVKSIFQNMKLVHQTFVIFMEQLPTT